ncbi:coiled-coil domain-containing protein 175 [Paramisgurnus dabryanus]|uniref:coiled-coil domain-containing protein 175 n=1 Tax=Paramisgurnus dabryanus TaxID=90735 RepID=UPI003CCF6259
MPTPQRVHRLSARELLQVLFCVPSGLLTCCLASFALNKMTACLVPDVPAVRIALEHLSELDKRLREESVSFSQEASHHLREISEAIKELEACRKTARDKLEVETIETSKLRLQTINDQDNITRELSACVSAAREGNAAELNQLQSELKTLVQDIESMETKQQLLEQENALLFQERGNLKEKYGDAIDLLNQQLSEKASIQILLTEKQNEINSLKEKIQQVQTAQQDLKEDMIQKRKTFLENKHTLETEIDIIVLKIKDQSTVNEETCKELDVITSELKDKEYTLTGYKKNISQLEKIIARLHASKTKCKEWLEEKINETAELDRQKDFHERELAELTEALEKEIQNLHEQIEAIEDEIEEEQKVRNALSEPVTKLSNIFNTQRKEEDEAIAEKHSLSERLQESKLSHEKHIISTGKCKIEIKNMKKEVKQLHDTNIISTGLFKKKLEELEAQVAMEKRKRAACDEEREKIYQALKTFKEEHEEHVRELNDAIELKERRYEELLEEEKKLQDHVLLSSTIKDLAKELASTKEEGKQLEIKFQAEILRFTAEAESMTQTHLEKEQELKVQESILQQVNAEFNIDHLRHQTLKKQTTELETQKNNLELSIQEVTKQTAALVEPKDDLKRDLETSRAKHMEMLTAHAAEMASVEKSIYENGVMLEQVNMENSRLHVCIEQMKEEISDAQKDKEQYTQETEWMRKQAPSLFKRLKDVWTTDMVLTEESADMEQKIMENINGLMIRIQNRQHDISDINSRLEKELRAMNIMIYNPNKQQKTGNKPS